MSPGGGPAGEAPVMMVLRGPGLGGLLTAVPALRALRRAHPEHRIVLAAPASLAGLLPLIGAVDELLDVAGPGPLPPVPSPDIAVNLHDGSPQSIAALRRTHPGRLLTHAHPGFPDVPGPSWSQDAHEVRRWCDLLGWYGIAADPADLALKVPLPGEPAPVVVHPGAAGPARRWPPERFALVSFVLRQAGHDVVITGSAGGGHSPSTWPPSPACRRRPCSPAAPTWANWPRWSRGPGWSSAATPAWPGWPPRSPPPPWCCSGPSRPLDGDRPRIARFPVGGTLRRPLREPAR